MTSTRESSPASEADSCMQLTPRSKVTAMLAALGDDSDEDNATSLPKLPQSPSLPQQTTRKSLIVEMNHDAEEEESEDEEDEIIKPRGRIAARMHAALENKSENKSEDARSRVKKMLAAQTETKESSPVKEDQNGNSEDDDLTIGPRRRQNRTTRTPTPERESGSFESESPGGFFVSPASGKGSRQGSVAADFDDDLPKKFNPRFEALVQRKKEERLAREAKIAKEKAKKAAKEKRFSDMLDQDDELDVGDSEIEKKLTQSVRSSRKAGKRALEEMKRETQRMNRNMQLTHEARTKKKITKDSLFAKFNYRQSNFETEQPDQIRPTSSSSVLQSEQDARETTPPTSPSLHVDETLKTLETPLQEVQSVSAPGAESDDEELMTLGDLLATKPNKADKIKGKPIPSSPPYFQQPSKDVRPAQKLNFKGLIQKPAAQDDSDSELEITYPPRKTNRKKKLDAIFDGVPARRAQEPHSLQVQRMLAHLNSPDKKNSGKTSKSSMTGPELQISLQQRIRQQALREKAEREQALRDRGIFVLTAEEREKEMVDVEDLMAKARREADELTKKEKGDAKRERKENGEVDPLGDSSDDEDWQENKEPAEVELSGSESEHEVESDDADGEASGEEEDEEEEDEEEAMLDDADDAATSKKETSLFDNEASEAESEKDAEMDSDENEIAEVSNQIEDDEDDVLPTVSSRRRTKNTRVLSDDEDEQVALSSDRTPAPSKYLPSPMPPKTVSPAAPTSVLRSATKTFIPGLTVAGPAGLGLTQIFQGTMDDTQSSQTQVYSDLTTVPETSSGADRQDSMAFLRMPPPTLPTFESTVGEDFQDIVMDSQPIVEVPASQPQEDSPLVNLQFSQSQIHDFDSLADNTFGHQYSEFTQQTQDVGFRVETPIVNRFISQTQTPQPTAPYSTVETVPIEHAQTPSMEHENSPTVKRPGRLRRRNQIQHQLDEDDAAKKVNVEDESGFHISANAFDVMRKAAKKKTVVEDNFDKNKSKAKEMVHEQADESEDEYAGLGGASDDESGGEDDALVKAMIDDEAGKEADERELAAFFADKERAKDSKDVEKLFKDITNGMLRRKRGGGDFSLSDSEDDGEARRNQKRTEFARMRKALLEDKRIGKIAQNPKQSAFLAAIEDRERDDEIDFLDAYEDSQEVFESQTQEEPHDKDVEMTGEIQVPATQLDTSMGPSKRKRSEDNGSDIENRPPPNLRRTKGSKRPSNLSEIRESLSSLIEEPNALVDADNNSDLEDSDLEIIDGDEDELTSGNGTDREARKAKQPRDPFALRRTHGIHIVDRISLIRASSSNISSTTKLAFAAPSTTSSLYSSKVPPLLRKATSNLSTTSNSSGIAGLTGAAKASLVEGAGSGIKRGGSKKSGIAYQARETERRKKMEESEKRREKKKFKGAEKRRGEVGGLFGRGAFE